MTQKHAKPETDIPKHAEIFCGMGGFRCVSADDYERLYAYSNGVTAKLGELCIKAQNSLRNYSVIVPGTQLTLEGIRLAYSKAIAERDRLRQINAELVAALDLAISHIEYWKKVGKLDYSANSPAAKDVRLAGALIAKAKEQS